MIIVLERGATEERIQAVLSALQSLELRGKLITVLENPMIHVVAGRSRAARKVLRMEGVSGLLPTPGPRIRTRGRYFFPFHLINWIAATLVMLGCLIVLAGFLPPGVGAEVDRLTELREIAIPWYLRAPHALLALDPGGWLALLGLGALLFFLPFYDRSRPGGTAAPLPVFLGALALFSVWLFFTVAW